MSSKFQQTIGTTQKSPSYKGSYRVVVEAYEPAHSCPVCENVFRDDVDLKNFFDRGACAECVDTYYYPNAELWDDEGWRPDLKGDKNDV